MARDDDELSSPDISRERTPLLHLSESLQSESTNSLESPDAVLAKARRLLYVSHLFNQFSENAWQFCLILFLAAFSNYQSFILVSSYGLVSALCVCYFGSAAGRFIDGANRLLVARRFIGMENLAVLLATFFCYVLLAKQGTEPEPTENGNESKWSRLEGVPTDPQSIFLLIGIHVLGATARILDSGFIVAVERDWIVVMSRCVVTPNLSQSEQSKLQKKWLSDTNVTMKQIDLSCKIAAPAFAGFFVALLDDGTDPHHGSDLRGAALFVGCLNAMALGVEYVCTAKIYNQIPELAVKSPTSQPADNGHRSSSAAIHDKKRGWSNNDQHRCILRVPDGLKVYLEQEISWAGIGLSLLYLNVLTFGGIMTAYLVWRGMRMEAIGIWRGVSSAAGLAGTFVYHMMSSRMTLIESGMYSLVFQFLCLSLSYASLFVDDYNTSLAMLIAGVCASRIGLWVFDISVTQLMQLHIPEDIRGLVGGVQQSMNAFFGLLSFALGIVIPDPKYFYVYVSAGYASVGLAVVCFGFGVFAKRQQLSVAHDMP